jgi:RNA polymerase sigma factor (sigma-70 family)
MSQDFADLLLQHQAQLIGWCARLSGDLSAAEDLAQDTMIQAWHIRHKLTDSSGLKPWLYSIARFMCLRWRQESGQHHAALEDELFADPFDLEAEFEHGELGDLLDKAMRWLPPDTRGAMVARFLDGQPPHVIAARLAITENTLVVRLHRGKHVLHQTLKTQLRAQAQAYGLLDSSDDWQPTRLWCYACGQRHLNVCFDPAQGNFVLYCSGCRFVLEQASGVLGIIGEVRGIKSVIKRLARWSNNRFTPAGSQVDCASCGQSITIRISQRSTDRGSEIDLDASCLRCGSTQRESLYGQAIHSPEGQQFWRAQERIRILPHRFLEMDGQQVVMTTLESVRNTLQLHIFSAYSDGRVLRVEN